MSERAYLVAKYAGPEDTIDHHKTQIARHKRGERMSGNVAAFGVAVPAVIASMGGKPQYKALANEAKPGAKVAVGRAVAVRDPFAGGYIVADVKGAKKKPLLGAKMIGSAARKHPLAALGYSGGALVAGGGAGYLVSATRRRRAENEIKRIRSNRVTG